MDRNQQENHTPDNEEQEKKAAGQDTAWTRSEKCRVALVLICGLLAVWGAARLIPESVTVSNSVDGRELPIYCVQTDQKVVGLSFDAAWGNSDSDQILAILKKHNVHVTYFMTGGWVEAYPEDVKKILAAGHDIGNHSENHKNMSQLSNEENKEELMKVHNKVKELTGYEMDLFRPPYGDYDNDVIKVATECGYYTCQWSVDSLDWKNYGVDPLIKTVCEHKNLDNGAIILMHNGADYTADALDAILTGLKEQGYSILPLSELIIREDYHLDHTGKQIPNH